MQFVANGPDIPNSLLQAHEEGRVVFFCGAGISYPAGLKGFRGLVDDIFSTLGTTLNPIEKAAYRRCHFDATLDLLERRYPGGRLAVRSTLVEVLQPNLRPKGATDTHRALLLLARSREGSLRLVTTNFDRIFARVTKRSKPAVPAYPAPLLPMPKKSRWNGLVYLHGLLPEHADEIALNRLVLTSGDFGLAYLTERWAARFVSELFRNFVVCFVGYSINDPVLRYMMDALAADRMLGEVTPQAYALSDYTPGKEKTKIIEWEAKGVVPVLYQAPTTKDHSALHRTLKAWSETYRDGIQGKERIVVDYARARPSASTQQDDFVGRMLWALSDKSGLPAKRFADFDPVPSLDWLEALSEDRFQHSDLNRFGVPPLDKADENLRFSLFRRPAPYTLSPWMMVVSGGGTESQWDEVTFHLARWLVRHLDDPALILWLAKRGGQLHARLARLIDKSLDTIASLDREGKTDDLVRIRAQAPNAIPRLLLRTLWRLLLTGRVKSPGPDLDLHRWQDRLKRDGLTTSLRLEFRELLAPRISLRSPFRWSGHETQPDAPERLNDLVDWELVLAGDHIGSVIRDLSDPARSPGILFALLDDSQQLLRDALDLLREMGVADDRSDRSRRDLPSISPRWQNRGYRDWVKLIEMTRDGWLAVRQSEPARATRIAQDWFAVPYAAFKRLALFAARQDDCIDPAQWVDWLVDDDSWWLWSDETEREVLSLVVQQGRGLSPQAQFRLEAAILTGPPRAMYRDDLEEEQWQALVDRSVWPRLAKLRSSGANLDQDAAERLAALSKANPDWKLAENESDEFSSWLSGPGDPDFEDRHVVNHAPRNRRELVDWLQRPRPPGGSTSEDDWRETCRQNPYRCAYALCELAKKGNWPRGRWREALQAWSDEGQVMRSWRFIAPLVKSMPEDQVKDLAHGISWWLQVASKSSDCQEGILLELCRRVLALPHPEDEEADRAVNRALDHPVGFVTQALLNLWFRSEVKDNEGLPAKLEPIFTELCDTKKACFRHGRVLLASRLITLFRVDRPWTESHLLPRFDWEIDAVEARAAWQGFLWSPRLFRPLEVAFKAQFLKTAHHYANLGGMSRQFAAFLTSAALDPADTYTTQDFRLAFEALPQEALDEAAQALAQALEGAGEQSEEFWTHRIKPFWQAIWPKSVRLASKGMAESLARLSIAARAQFPAALTAVFGWLQPIEHPHFVVDKLAESGLCTRFPADALRLLDAVIDDQPLPPEELGSCLEDINRTEPALAQDPHYRRVSDYYRRRSI
jgi:hypothetical protein